MSYPNAYASHELATKDKNAYRFNCGMLLYWRNYSCYPQADFVLPSTSPARPCQLHREPALVPRRSGHLRPPLPLCRLYPRRNLGRWPYHLRPRLHQLSWSQGPSLVRTSPFPPSIPQGVSQANSSLQRIRCLHPRRFEPPSRCRLHFGHVCSSSVNSWFARLGNQSAHVM